MTEHIKRLIAFVIIMSILTIPCCCLTETDLFAVSYTTYDTSYDAIIKMYIKVLNKYGTGKTGRHDLFNELIIADFNSDYDSPLKNRIEETKNRVGYCIYDLNGDGTNELIIGENPSYVFEVFTIDNGKVRELIRAGYHYQCALLSDGRFYRYSKDGAALDTFTIWKMNGTGKVRFVEGRLRDAEPPDHSLTPNDFLFFKMKDSKQYDGTVDTLIKPSEFLSWLKKYDQDVLQIGFIPISIVEQGFDSDFDKIGVVTVNGKAYGNSTVRIRSKASNKSKVVKNCRVGTYVLILEEVEDYYKIQVGKKEGYIHKDFLTHITDVTNGKRYNLDYNEYAFWINGS